MDNKTRPPGHPTIPLAGFGLGVGLVISQLGNVVMSSVDGSKASEAGGLQGAGQSLGQSLGTALIGAVLLTGLTVTPYVNQSGRLAYSIRATGIRAPGRGRPPESREVAA